MEELPARGCGDATEIDPWQDRRFFLQPHSTVAGYLQLLRTVGGFSPTGLRQVEHASTTCHLLRQQKQQRNERKGMPAKIVFTKAELGHACSACVKECHLMFPLEEQF